MKKLVLRLVAELMKNSRRSDRDLAKVLGVSQPTITRTRTRLEKAGIIGEYTMIPRFSTVGFEILALTLIKWSKSLAMKEFDEVMAAGIELDKKEGLSVLMVARGLGADYDMAILSLHKDYSEYTDFLSQLRSLPFSDRFETDNFLVSLHDVSNYRLLTLSALADYVERHAL